MRTCSTAVTLTLVGIVRCGSAFTVPAVLTCWEARCWSPSPPHTSPCHRHHYTFTCAGTLTFKSWYCISALFFDENKTKQNKLYRNDPRSVGFREQCVRHARAPVKGRVATYLICLAEKKKMRQKSLSFRDQSLLRSDQIATGIYIDVTV